MLGVHHSTIQADVGGKSATGSPTGRDSPPRYLGNESRQLLESFPLFFKVAMPVVCLLHESANGVPQASLGNIGLDTDATH